MTYFCPQCFAQIAKETIDCPGCGIHVPSWQQTLDYTDRLIHALNHPLAEVRMGAIISLGNRGDPRAALPLARCALGHPTDIVEGLEIVDRLCQLTESVERTQALQMLANSHPGHVVRKAAKKSLPQAPIEVRSSAPSITWPGGEEP